MRAKAWTFKDGRAGPGAESPDLVSFLANDHGNAARLIAIHGEDLRFCHAFKKWLVWDGMRWAVDDTDQARRLAKLTMLEFLRQAPAGDAAEKFARASLDSRRISSLLSMAECEIFVRPADLDTDPFALNFLNGTVDLRTAVLREHRKADLITKLVRHQYRPGAKCPRWLAFLTQIMGAVPDAGEAGLQRADELIDYLQLALGYSITGEAGEKAVFVAHGSGDNGKTTMLSLVRDVTREYATVVGLDLLTTRDESNNVAAARAKLLGARFVTSSETEEGQRLSAARLKRICQGPGGEIEACRKFENPVTFPETHKLWIDANHKPELPASDAAVWNRLHLIPFTVTIPKDRQDRELKTKLLKEAEGILAWLVEGARRWYATGLPDSKAVAKATTAWRVEMDRLSAYLDEHTSKADDPNARLPSRVLYENYKSWCESNGERALTQARFSRQMEAMGFVKERKESGIVWCGIRFRRL